MITDRSILWIPPVEPELVMWAGLPLLPAQALARYDVDEVHTTNDLKNGLQLQQLLNIRDRAILVIPDRLDTSVFDHVVVKSLNPQLNSQWARQAIEACRVTKDSYEISMIRHANAISSYAHEQVLASAKRARNERELNAVFVMHCHANGCKDQAYGCICAGGQNASSLHYLHNDALLEGKLNLLLDAGCEYSCYCSDITRSFPLNGKFTQESREIYDLVLRMQSECMSMIKAGVLWEDVHMRAHEVAGTGLQQLGVLKKDVTLATIMDSKVTCRFFPHGLGHYLGMDTHDVGGNANYGDENEYFTYLRIRGRLPIGSVVTNEPGIYFREFPFAQELIDGKWDSVVNRDTLKRYWSVGGIRIEDDIHVLEHGCENLTTVVSGIDDIEKLVNCI